MQEFALIATVVIGIASGLAIFEQIKRLRIKRKLAEQGLNAPIGYHGLTIFNHFTRDILLTSQGSSIFDSRKKLFKKYKGLFFGLAQRGGVTLVVQSPEHIQSILKNNDACPKLKATGIHLAKLEHSCTQANGKNLTRQRKTLLTTLNQTNVSIIKRLLVGRTSRPL